MNNASVSAPIVPSVPDHIVEAFGVVGKQLTDKPEFVEIRGRRIYPTVDPEESTESIVAGVESLDWEFYGRNEKGEIEPLSGG